MKISDAAQEVLSRLNPTRRAVRPASEDSDMTWGEILTSMTEGHEPPFSEVGILTPFYECREISIVDYVLEIASVFSQVAA